MNIRNILQKAWKILLFVVVNANLFAQTIDTDNDGVPNDKDLCLNTPLGTVVNAYGCPTTLANCDYTTSSFSSTIVGLVPTETRYLLVNSATGVISQVNTVPTFGSLSGTNTYMVLAYSYTGTPTGLAVGNQLSAVSTSCQDFSNALVIKSCVVSPLPTLSLPTAISVNENGVTASITVTLSSASASNVTVNYSTANGTATAGTDYANTSGTITFLPGETSKVITIPIIDDAINEATENFTLTLSNPSGATVGTAQTTITITDNDLASLPTLSLPTAISVNENGVTASITVTLSSASASNVTVNYSTANGTATAGTDYANTSGTITFLPGETSKVVTIPIIDDAINEATESFTLTLSNPSGATISTAQTTVTVIDNDVVSNDTDNDGVPNDKDLCLNTPLGTVVNAYGCPTTLANCDYNSGSFTVSSTIPPVGKQTKYVLANAADGRIVQVSSIPTFSGLTGTKTFMVLAYSYEDDNTLVNLNANKFLSEVSAVCSDWSNALVVKVCVPFVENGVCDFTSSTVTLNTVTSPPANTKFVLVNQMGTIVQVSNSTTFTNLSGTNTYNAYAISYANTISGLNIGSNFSSVTGDCYDWSNPLSIKVCVCKPNICIPILVTKIK